MNQPQETKDPGAGGKKIDHGAEGDAWIEEQAELALPDIQGEQQQREQKEKAEQRVHQPGKPGVLPADSPQKIIKEAQQYSQAACQQKLHGL